MRSLFKRIALIIPQLRHLHEERNQYAQNVTDLSKRLSNIEAICRQREEEKKKLVSACLSLKRRATHFARLIPANAPQRLHVVGYARSGTTITMDILNSSGEVFLFSELNLHVLRRFPELFSAYGGNGFVEHFLNRKRKEIPLLYKSACPPSALHGPCTPDDYVDAVGKHFKFVGDKIATAHRHMANIEDIELLKEFLNDEAASGAFLFLLLRRPSSNLGSALRMFPEADRRLWGASLAKTIAIFLQLFLRANKSYLIFHEDIGPSLISELSALLGIQCNLSPALVGPEHQSKQEEGPNESWLTELDAAYDVLTTIYSCDLGTLKHSKTDSISKKLAPVVDKFSCISARLANL